MPSLSFLSVLPWTGKNVGIGDLRYYVTNNKAIYYSRDHLSTLSQNCNVRVKSHLITIIIIIILWMGRLINCWGYLLILDRQLGLHCKRDVSLEARLTITTKRRDLMDLL